MIYYFLAYEQQYVRTMFFEKVEKIVIDGNMFEISNNTGVEIFNCKERMVDIKNHLDQSTIDTVRDKDNYTAWKKELIKYLKEWDKWYVKHIKSAYPEMSGIHAKCMMPLTLLIEANLNFDKLEKMIA